jgi:hypothetical protein
MAINPGSLKLLVEDPAFVTKGIFARFLANVSSLTTHQVKRESFEIINELPPSVPMGLIDMLSKDSSIMPFVRIVIAGRKAIACTMNTPVWFYSVCAFPLRKRISHGRSNLAQYQFKIDSDRRGSILRTAVQSTGELDLIELVDELPGAPELHGE